MDELVVTEALKDIDKSKAEQIRKVFEPMVMMLKKFESEYDEIVAKEINEDVSKEAKTLRVKISKIRIAADKERESLKEEYLRGGKAVQGVYNILKFAITDKEKVLKEIEDHEKILEEKRIAKLHEDRKNELLKYDSYNELTDFGLMEENVWNIYLESIKDNYFKIKEAEKRIEEERIQKIKEEKEERERLQKEVMQNKIILEQKERELAEEKERAKQIEIANNKLKEEKEREYQKVIEKERYEKEKLRKEVEREINTKKQRPAIKNDSTDKENLGKLLEYIKEIGKQLQKESNKVVLRRVFEQIKNII